MRVIVFDLNFEVFDSTFAMRVFDLKIFIPYQFNTVWCVICAKSCAL